MKKLRWMIALGASALLFVTGCPDDDDDEPEVTTREAQLAGENEVPPVASPGTGLVTARLEGSQLTVEGTFENLSSPLVEIEGSAAHIHEANEDENGPIVFNLEVTPGDDDRSGTFTLNETLNDDQQDAFRDGRFYVNIHTENYPGGELRAQLMEDAPEYEAITLVAETDLTPDEQPHEVTSEASGWAIAIMREDTRFIVSGAFENLSSALREVEGSAAHIERGMRGEAGEEFVFELEIEGEEEDEEDIRNGRFRFQTDELNDDRVNEFRNNEWFVNIRTEDHPDGELRGQLEPEDVDITPPGDVGIPDDVADDVEDDVADDVEDDVADDVEDDVADDVTDDVEDDVTDDVTDDVADDVEDDVTVPGDVDVEEDIFVF